LVVGLLHDLVYHQLGVNVGVESGCSELNGDVKAVDEARVFGDVVRGWEFEASCDALKIYQIKLRAKIFRSKT
jgi:hypothetical protein